jgi:hypothetical protein
MRNGSRLKRAKQSRLPQNSHVSIGNKTGLWKEKDKKRKADACQKKKATDRVETCKIEALPPLFPHTYLKIWQILGVSW